MRTRRFAAIWVKRLAFAILFLPTIALAQNPSIQMDKGVLHVVGWNASVASVPAGGWSSIFSVYVGQEGVPPVLGTYSVENGSLLFRPQFPFTPGVMVRAVFHVSGSSEVKALFKIPSETVASSTRVAHVYPSTDVLPANELKFYLYFSAPMSRGDAWRHVHLLRQDGSEITSVFLEIKQELWNRDNTRLTVLFDPGRIKRGVLPNLQMGLALEPGKRYTLSIDRDWLDGRGALLVEGYKKQFRVAPAERESIEPSKWRVTSPQQGTSNPIVLDFPRPLDYPLLQRFLTVSGPTGDIAGKALIDRNETQWRFVPARPWNAGAYSVIVNTQLEDLAGNRVGSPFDVDTFNSVTEHITTDTVSVPFQVR